ncbi:MAG: hypothetical protein AAGB97_10055 [Dehalococcoidia bacterium]|nr:hypothetical protein [Chloroflexota bacterium]MBT9161543.1 hypothetical protein [Chloroflexota bacterium]
MLKAIEGIYHDDDGKIELSDMPGDIHGKIRVIVTFLEPSPVDLRVRRIDEVHAAELRARLATFAEDWDSPEMEVYDVYGANKS